MALSPDFDRFIERAQDTCYSDAREDALSDPVIQNLILEVERSMDLVRHELEVEVRRKIGDMEMDVEYKELDQAIMAWKGLVR